MKINKSSRKKIASIINYSPLNNFTLNSTTAVFVFALISAISAGFFYSQNKNIAKYCSISPSPSPVIEEKINDGGPIEKIKTVSTDEWEKVDKTLITQDINYSYKYPKGLFVVPNMFGEKNTIYFFENKDVYKKFLACLKKQASTENSPDSCYTDANYLFEISLSEGYGLTDFICNKPSELIQYDGWSENIWWILPKEDKINCGGAEGKMDFFAEAKTKQYGWIKAEIYYWESQSNIDKIKNISGFDIYPLFTHILSSFEIK